MHNHQRYFVADDTDHLEEGLRRYAPDLYLALYAAKQARQKLTFPLHRRDDLAPLLNEKHAFVFDQRTIESARIKSFLPDVFFPIESVEDFVAKVYISLCAGKESHVQTRRFIDASKLVAELQIDPKMAVSLFGTAGAAR